MSESKFALIEVELDKLALRHITISRNVDQLIEDSLFLLQNHWKQDFSTEKSNGSKEIESPPHKFVYLNVLSIFPWKLLILDQVTKVFSLTLQMLEALHNSQCGGYGFISHDLPKMNEIEFVQESLEFTV